MSAPEVQPEEGAPDQGALNGTGESAPENTGEAPAADLDPFTARLRTDPDFAESQVKDLQRTLSRNQEQLKRLEGQMGDLGPLLQNLGGDAKTVMEEVQKYAVAQSNPAVKQALDHYFQYGQLPNGLEQTDSGYSGYEEPENQQLAALQKQLDDMKQSMQQMQGNVFETRLDSAKQRFVDYMQGLKGQYGDEYYDRIVKPHFQNQLEMWQNDPQGQKALENISGEALDLIHGDMIRRNFKELAKSVLQAQDKQTQSAATGPPPGTSTSPATSVESGLKKGASVEDWMKEADRLDKSGQLPSEFEFQRGYGHGGG